MNWLASLLGRAPGLAFILGAIIISQTQIAGAEDTNAPRPTLTGVVRDEAGNPVTNVVVFIYTAGPKEGPSNFCPSCYADCRKQAATDAEGKFTIASLDPDLIFRILVAGGSWEPKFVSKVDPAKKSLSIKLKRQPQDVAADHKLLGRVVDAEGKPVDGAVVNIRGVTRGTGTRFGGNYDVDQVAVSDRDGNFMITSTNPFTAAGVDVEARGLAKGIFKELSTGGQIHTLKLTEGATIKGRVLANGQPLAGVVIDVSGANRESSAFVGDFSIATDADGRFLIANLPPNTRYVVCGTMDSLRERGCIPAQNFTLDDDGETSDTGDLQVQPAFVLEGQIRMADGQPVPANEHVLLGRETPWDNSQVVADGTGHFRFTGVPPEMVSLSARVPGYRLSARNVSLDMFNPFGMTGRMVTNKTDLIMEYEPGKELPRAETDYEMANAVRQEPLRGAEAFGAVPADAIKVTGTVSGTDTQKSLPSFTVTEGRKNAYDDAVSWFVSRATAQSNGVFTVYLHKRAQSPPFLSIGADGYVPQKFGPITVETNFTVVLKPGTGPVGVVREPDGTPAANVTVYLADDNRNGVYLDSNEGKLRVREEIYRATPRTQTDGTGHFRFPSQPGAFAVIVVDTNGFADVRVGALATNSEVRLQPYARVEGRLMIGSRPGTNATIDLDLTSFPYADYPRQFPPINLFLSASTDGDGKFVFPSVPPVPVFVFQVPPVRDGGMGVIPQSQMNGFVLAPGETRHIMLGGQGRPVIGKMVVTGYDGKIDFRQDVQSLETVVAKPAAMPDLSTLQQKQATKLRALDSAEAQQKAEADFQPEWEAAKLRLGDFYQTDAGREYFFAERRFALNFSKAQDGTFRIEDVPGGKYNLQFQLHEPGDQPFTQPVIASINKQITVPDSPGGRSDEPFDLGTLEMTPRHGMKAGKIAPDFSVKTIDGQPLKLADFKGKYVLLDFWATWCGPCVAETPNLKATWDAYKNNTNFAMVSLSLDEDTNAPAKFAAKNGVGWTQGFLGNWSKDQVTPQWGVDGIPAIFLIGPDGKIIAGNLRGEAIMAAVGNVLARK